MSEIYNLCPIRVIKHFFAQMQDFNRTGIGEYTGGKIPHEGPEVGYLEEWARVGRRRVRICAHCGALFCD